MEVRAWMNGVRVGRERNLTTSPLWKCHARPQPCYPPRAGIALREAVLNERGSVYMWFDLVWVEHLCLPVLYQTILPVCTCSASFIRCNFQKCPFFSTMTSNAGLVDKGEDLHIPVNLSLKDILLDFTPPQSKLILVTICSYVFSSLLPNLTLSSLKSANPTTSTVPSTHPALNKHLLND